MTNDSAPASLLKTLGIEIAVPLGVYYGLHSLGASDFTALALAGVFPLARTLFQFARNRTINGLALVVLVTNVAGMVLTFVSGDARMMIAKDSIGSGTTGLVILISAFTAQPIMTRALRPFLTHGKADHEAAWDRLQKNDRFTTVVRRSSYIWGVGFVLESAARVVGAFTLPVSTMVWLSTVLFAGSFAVIMLVAGASAKAAGEMVAREAEADVKQLVAA
ncbi:VC0807 family protein [Amycolatopsis mongoliensis]|uniref:VC0807 family protein n=1 Tax=Amycolatopsis mongoliensis TaxID=715475 RepID=A0A9Y2NK92_9PSEU|nr:VC0807 family protein [Amycolatopsis sp. 4-36]WIY04814.1 VC0807 family protein [Amycolatopsis sp. 4-36]